MIKLTDDQAAAIIDNIEQYLEYSYPKEKSNQMFSQEAIKSHMDNIRTNLYYTLIRTAPELKQYVLEQRSVLDNPSKTSEF